MPNDKSKEIDDIRDVVNELVKKLEQYNNTQSVMNYRLEQVEKKVNEHTQLLVGDVENPGLLIYISKLDNSQKNNSKLLYILITLLTGLYALLIDLLVHII